MSVILGLNAYHADSSACIVVDGKLVACAEEERFRRVKHWAGFPTKSIQYCLSASGVSLERDIQVAVNSNSKANLSRKIGYILSHRSEVSMLLGKLKNRRRHSDIPEKLAASFPERRFADRVHNVEHHLAHLASAYFAGSWDEAIAVSFDGFGDFASAAWGHAINGNIKLIDHVWFPHSMGIFYQAITQFLGFPAYGDEYKVMGLASYGRPTYVDEMLEVVELADGGKYVLDLKYFRHARENISYSWAGGAPEFETLYTRELEELLGPARNCGEELVQRHSDIARSAQWMYEQAFFHFLNSRYEQFQCANLVLAGGCAMNSVANGRITSHTPFENVYVQSAAGDAGGALGAAFVAASESGDSKVDRGQMPHAFWGPEFSEDAMATLLASGREDLDIRNCRISKIENENALCEIAAAAIRDGLVVGWFQGRMEWGPRSLGNRSILCDPRRADMKDILNKKIKRRESFRPFAPSVLREKVHDWFEQDDDVPFMMKVFQVKESKQSLIPAVTHVDGSGRLQTVTRKDSSLYYKLISEFEYLTGVPMVLNTSFNENEPIVCRPDEALACFLRTDMDLLILGHTIIRRTSKQLAYSAQEETMADRRD
ncbi:MAG: carbamoyltransferase [Rhodothermia bacterium]|nr:MAG: carbamoyltransferase [Rhodothermia bacterium]